MTSNESSKTPGKPAAEGSGPKKPSALLDLKATEVKSESKPASAGAAGTPASSVPASGAPASASGQRSSEASASPKAAASPSSKPTDAASAPNKPAGSDTSDPKRTSSQAKPTPEPATTTAAAKSASSSLARLATHLGAGVAGGILALLLAAPLGSRLGTGTLPQVVNELQQRLAAAEQAIRERTAVQSAVPAELEQKLSNLEGQLARLDELNQTLGTLSEAQVRLSGEAKALADRIGQGSPAEVSERVAKLEQMLDTLTAAAGSEEAGRIPQLAAITGKLADLEATIPNQLTELRKSLSEEIETRLAQSAEASEAARSATLRMDRELASAKADIARLTQRDEALKSTDDRLEQTLRVVQEEAGSLRSDLDGLKSEFSAQLKSLARAQDLTAAVAPVENRLATLEQSVQDVIKSEEDRRINAERIVLSLELGNLKRALDRGGSYANELAEVTRIGAGKIDLTALERYKDQGVPTLADLSREFRPVAHAIIDAAQVPEGASTFDRLLMGAKSIVRVRRTEHSPDDTSVEAVVARMENALAAGKPSDVLALAQQLPPKAAEPAQTWLEKVAARAAVDRVLASVEDQLKASLSGKAPDDKRTH